MKAIKCEMCDSTDVIKQNGVFVCQHCGTKYSVEETKKLMVEGTMDVSGSTVKLDYFDELENLYNVARRSGKDANFENAEKYYELILSRDSNSWEACFYSTYYKAMNCKNAEIHSAILSIAINEESSLRLIHDHVPDSLQKDAVEEVVDKSIHAAYSLSRAAYDFYSKIHYTVQDYDDFKKCKESIEAAINTCFICGNLIDMVFNDKPEIAKLSVRAWSSGIDLEQIHEGRFHFKDLSDYIEKVEKIKKYDAELAEHYINDESERRLKKINAEEKHLSSIKKVEFLLLSFGIIFLIISVILFIKNGYGVGGIFFIILGIVFFILSYKKNKQHKTEKKNIQNMKDELQRLQQNTKDELQRLQQKNKQ